MTEEKISDYGGERIEKISDRDERINYYVSNGGVISIPKEEFHGPHEVMEKGNYIEKILSIRGEVLLTREIEVRKESLEYKFHMQTPHILQGNVFVPREYGEGNDMQMVAAIRAFENVKMADLGSQEADYVEGESEIKKTG